MLAGSGYGDSRRGNRRVGKLAAGRRRGAALPLVLLLLLAVTALGHGAFVLSLEEEEASRASAALLQARVMAEGGVRRALEALRVDTLPAVGREAAVLLQGSVPGASFRVEVRYLTREIFWVEGRGSAAPASGGPERAQARAGRLLWALSPLARLAASRAVLEHGAELYAPDSGSVDAAAALATGVHAAPRGCADRREVLDSALVGRALPATLAVSFAGAHALPDLGFLGGETLLERASLRAASTVTPAPSTAGDQCLTDALLNWGSPSDPAGPCGGHRPVVAAQDDLELLGGEGQGVLMVPGDLRLTAAARYEGLVLVGGDLVVEGGSVLVGLARARGRVRVEDGGRVVVGFCPVLLALEAAPVLRRPVDLPGGGWIRPF